LGKELYDLLISPVEDYLQTASHLVIVPSDVLFYLPFGALFRCPGCGTKRELWGGEYLIERYSISYAPSLTSLYWPFKHRGDGVYHQALVVGNPTGDLEYAGEEAQGIASLFPRAELVVGDAGTKATVLGLIGGGNYDVIHLATHGEFDRELPLASRVYFNQWEPLYAGEMLGLGLQGCELVVLSACQTGLPPEVTEELVLGDELQGLSQALFVAGTPSALLTLWNVADESTQRLMVEMYQELMGGVPKGEALRRAQLSLLRNPMYRHPYYWAPFVLYGVWR
jgi:CHAT domain-containing protein